MNGQQILAALLVLAAAAYLAVRTWRSVRSPLAARRSPSCSGCASDKT
jgi:hypothetical protein